MTSFFKPALLVAAVALASQASAQITFYESANFGGRSFTTEQRAPNFKRVGFNDRATSAYVTSGRWEVCDDIRFGGRCMVLRPGRYTSLQSMGLNDRVASVRAVGSNAQVSERRYAPLSATPQVTFYENDNFEGRAFNTEAEVSDFKRYGFNDRASSVVVLGDRWEVCSDARFGGQCMVLRPGRYASLTAMGMNDRLSSARATDLAESVDSQRLAPEPVPVYDSRRRGEERLFDARVSSARAVVGPAEQRCWVEREDVPQTKGDMNIGGAVAGALLGGILGHQVGGGVGKDIATVGGAVAGAAVGANVGRNANGQPATQRDVKRCADQPASTTPAFWDVSYTFRGKPHRVQMRTEPGETITVNANGEPRSE